MTVTRYTDGSRLEERRATRGAGDKSRHKGREEMPINGFPGSAAVALLPMMDAALAQDVTTPELPACEDCSDSIVIVSWGDPDQAMHLKTYVQPYIEAPGD